MMINAVRAKNGIVIKPNQLMYCPVQGILPHAGAISVNEGKAFVTSNGREKCNLPMADKIIE